MLPQSVLSTEVVAAQFEFPRNVPRAPLIDYEYGGRAIQDPSLGLRYQVWRAEYLEDQIWLSAPEVAAFSLLTIPTLETFGFTFDQNMQPFVCWQLTDGTSYFRWFDSTVSGFVTTQLPADSLTPRCCLDDNRAGQLAVSDIILAYTRAGSLYFRAQRDRFETEYELADDVGESQLIQIGLNRQLRLQFQLSSTPEQLDSPA